ncbi:MAG: hypothetical protein LBE92_03835 [Chryseobacterium sp.]|jgi:hypothetical protein|uniref:hypothetical protein n=1 Tax=Chryseobacterium sp. TaxID=1871047 RepID=UPI0028178479|nr:hypothetical protein [Chryseobacterium sp.]MDR2235232.1 hypothetical protein [Chryseobacterium sp.]
MKKICLTLLPLAANFLFSQTTYYSGRFLDLKDHPRNFLKIYNKNSGVYELTDENGFAIIEAREKDTLIWNNGKSSLVVNRTQELKKILEGRIEKKNVYNITSKAYDSLVTKELQDEFSLENSRGYIQPDRDYYNYYSPGVRKIKRIGENSYLLEGLPKTELGFGGSFTTSLDIKHRNSIPDTQNRYVQGRSENGQLIWRGPETGEMFSFGPDISLLGYDHQPYPYDVSGRLIPLANGGSRAKAYRNDIFKTVAGYNNQLRLNTVLKKGYAEKLRLSLDLGQQKDMMYFADQYTILNSFKAKLNTEILKYSLNFGFNYDENKAVNSNRIGLFNRMYQNSLLTPVSFSNAQNKLLPDGSQRSYSQSADNPYFLPDHTNRYNYREQRRQFSFELSRNWKKFDLNIRQTYENDAFRNTDSYQPSVYGFLNGISNEREQNNALYYSNIQGTYSLGSYNSRHVISFNFILNNRETDLYNSYTQKKYAYQRTSQDYILNYKFDHNGNNGFRVGFNAGNAFYVSNTSAKNNYWLPKVSGYVFFDEIFNWYDSSFKLLGSYTQLSSEPEITRSYASYATTTLKAQNAYQYFPVREAETFRNLSNINSKEGKIGAIYTVNRRLNIEAEYFNRKITDDIFPVFENNRLYLKNMADHTYSGYEVNAEYNNLYLGTDFTLTNKASFFKYKDLVNRVNSGYNGLALSGFSDIYKTLSEGEVLGAVTGSYFKRNAAGELIIDESGYPEKAEGMKIIADPTPDFIMKFTHTLNYKMLTLDINWEWKRGGQVWNGTQAVLDYYGRSQSSGEDRNIKSYVFQGVNEQGSPNQIAVDFYDPDRNVSENRWTRYGYPGVAENYVQKADYIRINTISLTGKFNVGRFKNGLGVTLYVNNIMLWQANKSADPNQNFYDLENGRGLDFFNLPSYKTFGCMVSFQF